MSEGIILSLAHQHPSQISTANTKVACDKNRWSTEVQLLCDHVI